MLEKERIFVNIFISIHLSFLSFRQIYNEHAFVCWLFYVFFEMQEAMQ